jgi:hypothetical protein
VAVVVTLAQFFIAHTSPPPSPPCGFRPGLDQRPSIANALAYCVYLSILLAS